MKKGMNGLDTFQKWPGRWRALLLALSTLMLLRCSPASEATADLEEYDANLALSNPEEEVPALREAFTRALEGNLPEKAQALLEKLEALGAPIDKEDRDHLGRVTEELAHIRTQFEQATQSMDLEASRAHLAELEQRMGDTQKEKSQLQEVETYHIEKAYPDFQNLNFGAKALGWMRSQAEQGDRFAQTNLGLLYFKGIEVPVDYQRSLVLLRQAADQDLALAQVFLGQLYVEGKGIEASPLVGFQWVKKAANQGLALGQFVLASFYEKGIGVTQSMEQAELWLKKAASQGNRLAINQLKHLAEAKKTADARAKALQKEPELDPLLQGYVVRTEDGLAFPMVEIPAGSFLMGSPNHERDRNDLQEQQHRVTLTESYLLGKSEVTQAQWLAVMGENPSAFQDPTRPVEQVSWDDIHIFIERLNQKVTDGHRFRLPTEAEWEFGCRAGNQGAFNSNLSQAAWYTETAKGTTHPVARLKPNAWGLYDMHGNVYEWCQDLLSVYTPDPITDPQGSASGKFRVYRGGGWSSFAKDVRSAARSYATPNTTANNLGFRLACSKPDEMQER